jgi:malonyl-CoA/methylmalonyl-CoA synthetase
MRPESIADVDDALPLVRRAVGFGPRVAIADASGEHSYRRLLEASASAAAALLNEGGDLAEARVAFLAPPGIDYVAVQWGIWRAGGIAVPLGQRNPPPELEYAIDDADAAIVVAHPQYADVLGPIAAQQARQFAIIDAARSLTRSPPAAPRLPRIDPARRAMILYTSGTTSRPKGVVTTHANIQAQVESLVAAWEWSAGDRILHVLPLHHIHGIINALTCALWSGATCEMLTHFDATAVWERLSGPQAQSTDAMGVRHTTDRRPLTLFMAVPTIYAKLIAAWEAAPAAARQAMSSGAARLRLMVSGSAALPVATLHRWREITAHVLLERYGMTEIGMALSNPLHGPRLPGHVGTPLPGVEVRLADDAGRPAPPGTPGEIEVRGPGVFLEYWRRPEATQAAFRDGWFRTGDVAVMENVVENIEGHDSYRILGRSSVDIIKTGGYKVSALEIEEVLRTHPAVADCAVVGVPDDTWGERVAVAIVWRPAAPSEPPSVPLTLGALRAWAKDRLAPSKVPSQMLVVAELPRNSMGKVHKPSVAELARDRRDCPSKGDLGGRTIEQARDSIR